MIGTLFLLLSLFSSLSADISSNLPATMTIKVAPVDSVAGRPVQVQIDIIRTKDQLVEDKNFQLEGKPLSVQLIREERKAPQGLFSGVDQDYLIVSTYLANLGILSKGVKSIGPIFVTVGGLTIQSNVATFEVADAVVSDRFRIIADYTPKRIYPGVKIECKYKMIFYDSLQIVKEVLPLFSLSELQYEGAPQAESYVEGDATVQVITREARAQNSGTIEVAQSLSEAFRKKEDPSLGVTLIPPLLRAVSPPFSLSILPFPPNMPEDFTGALGAFTLRAQVLKEGKLKLGEPFDLEVLASGRGDISSLSLAKLISNQKLKGLIALSEKQPPVVIDSTKRFVLSCVILSPTVSSFPEIALSTFDPDSGQYLTMRFPRLQLTIQYEEASSDQQTLSSSQTAFIDPMHGSFERVVISPVLIVFVPILCLVLFLGQWYLFKVTVHREEEEVRSGYVLMLDALKMRNKPSESLPMVKRALLLRLRESGLIEDQVEQVDLLPSEGIVGEVKAVLKEIDQTLYQKKLGDAQKKEYSGMYEEASRVFYRIQRMKGGEP